METFEIHITGDESIIANAARLGVKTIVIDLLKPDKTALRTEYMTSIVVKMKNFDECLTYVKQISNDLSNMGTSIIREKIECPPYQHYMGNSLYMESHFKMRNVLNYPASRNQNKEYILGTDRVYHKSNYAEFARLHEDDELELCLYDSFVAEDADWMSLAWPAYREKHD